MKQCTFGNILQILYENRHTERMSTKKVLITKLFSTFLADSPDFHVDPSSITKWMLDQSKPSPKIMQYYDEDENGGTLTADIVYKVMPALSFPDKAVKQVLNLLIDDNSLDIDTKSALRLLYFGNDLQAKSFFLAQVILFTRKRQGIGRPNRLYVHLPQDSDLPMG